MSFARFSCRKRRTTGLAAEAYDRAIGLERDPAVRRFLQEKRAKLTAGSN
ncbi:hypothetical protein [Mesorhizobium sp.]|nr:hypothetical protein [Mesorhizobium sp.]